jgi:RimJ/RimL family protein N-acetyltransferase
VTVWLLQESTREPTQATMLLGPKVCLGPLLRVDGPVIFGWRNSPELMHLDWCYRPTDQTGFEEWFNSAGKDPHRVVFAIRRREDMQFLGYIQVVNINAAFRSAEIGIMIGSETNRRQGYGKDALRLGIDFCWQELNLQRLSLALVGDNPAALNAYRKCGFEHEGTLRRAVYSRGQFRDVTLMALLRVEGKEGAGASTDPTETGPTASVAERSSATPDSQLL